MKTTSGVFSICAALCLALCAVLVLAIPSRSSAGILETFTFPLPMAGDGLWVPDVQASYPGVNWATLDRAYIPAAHYEFIQLGNLPTRGAGDPLVITNTGGQVRVGGLDFPNYNFVVLGGSNWILTGRFDPVAQTGDVNFPGHGAGNYADSRGRYGFLIDDEFEDTGNSGLSIGGGATDFEVSFVEVTHVGFAGVVMKTDDNGSAHMENVSFHDNYIHDTGSEGVYFGSTQNQPQHKITGLHFYNNRLVRTGTEALQVGQVGGGSKIHNNVFMLGAIDWKNPFQNYQDNHSQIAAREGAVDLHDNISIGGASTFAILFSQDVAGDSHDAADVVNFRDNYYSHSRSIGVYIHMQANGIETLRFSGNAFREINFQYDELNPTSLDVNAVFRIFNVANPIELLNNQWDGPQVFAQVAGSNVIQSGNTNTTIPPVVFIDSGFPPDFDYLKLELWTSLSILGDPVYYNFGDYVMHLGLLYECIQATPHTNRIPTSNPGTWAARPLPADDLRLATGSPFQNRGLYRDLVFEDGFESGNTLAWSQ